jgi:hypothetical protein
MASAYSVLGSELFPRWNHYELHDLPGIDEITQHLRAAGDYAKLMAIALQRILVHFIS